MYIMDFANKLLKKIKHYIWKIVMTGKMKRKYKKDIIHYNALSAQEEIFKVVKKDLYPCFNDMYENAAGGVDGHYFLQDIYMASKINCNAPKVHYDIGSRIEGFIAHLISASIVEKLIMLDIRPFPIKLPRLQFIQVNATDLLDIADNSIESLSSLHAIEHFGLGRYGDDIDPTAWERTLIAIQRVIVPGGYFYFSVPIGPKNKLCFNAHRIFQPSLILKKLDRMELISFACIHDMKITEIDIDGNNIGENIDKKINEYDCGMFIFQKKIAPEKIG